MNRDLRAANYLLLLFGIISMVLLSLPLTGKVGAFRAYASYLLDPVPFYGSRAFDRFANIPTDAVRLISGDIELLRARRRLREATHLQSENESLRRENRRLSEALGITPEERRVLRWARVMQRDSMNWHRSLTVSAGADDGMVVNAPVLGLKDGVLGVVGRVTGVRPKTSIVLLLTDDLSAAAAYLPANDLEGLIQGRGTHWLRMNYLPLGADIPVGEKVYTSPTSATFGPDLLIGTITRKFERDPFLAFQSVEVTPAVTAASLKEVLILLPEKEGGT
ncbi:MAG: rod shape-determining protein MreC [Elusimicrobiota bacterium]